MGADENSLSAGNVRFISMDIDRGMLVISSECTSILSRCTCQALLLHYIRTTADYYTQLRQKRTFSVCDSEAFLFQMLFINRERLPTPRSVAAWFWFSVGTGCSSPGLAK